MGAKIDRDNKAKIAENLLQYSNGKGGKRVFSLHGKQGGLVQIIISDMEVSGNKVFYGMSYVYTDNIEGKLSEEQQDKIQKEANSELDIEVGFSSRMENYTLIMIDTYFPSWSEEIASNDLGLLKVAREIYLSADSLLKTNTQIIKSIIHDATST